MHDLNANPEFWRGRRVLVTGHTGFKGAWLSLWLIGMGARVAGVALRPQTDPNLFELLGLDQEMRSHIFDINDQLALEQVFADDRPEIVLHLAAQPLVRASYTQPVGTFATNVVGVVTLLDVARRSPDLRAVVVVTSDKCYDNKEWLWGYRENDSLGGRDPYSASKGCTEIAVAAMRHSFFAPYASHGHPARIATVRAGNVIGGGDWAEDRLIPDVVRGCLGTGEAVALRNPHSIRPWQHVLEPLCGYLEIAEKLVTAPQAVDEAWNFGPDPEDERSVADVANWMVSALGRGRVVCAELPEAPHEARLLRLDCSKAKLHLDWRPRLRFEEAIGMTASWYRAWRDGKDVVELTRSQIANYMRATGTRIESTLIHQPRAVG